MLQLPQFRMLAAAAAWAASQESHLKSIDWDEAPSTHQSFTRFNCVSQPRVKLVMNIEEPASSFYHHIHQLDLAMTKFKLKSRTLITWAHQAPVIPTITHQASSTAGVDRRPRWTGTAAAGTDLAIRGGNGKGGRALQGAWRLQKGIVEREQLRLRMGDN
uniref:Uncharacterized protein n=1 Tax=Pristionchus pacificus TaxID=54126 RepID=A0A2A6BNS0_PRIPA|eukprot:PDM67433.1 hypothetical protein PRIPAC_48850 [Pristionchus pacificus]